MQLFISQQIKQNNASKSSSPEMNRASKLPLRQFTSRIGKLETTELQEWLKECKKHIKRVRDIIDLESASHESEACMHCDCRAVDNCRLRDVAEDFSIKDPRGKIVNSPIEKKININTGLVFENAKCIKCGLCVRLCEDSKDEPALCFINRGFISIISEPLTEDFNNILKSKTKEVIDICPTGALSMFSPLPL
jgi:predicted molibdopterin-dependent oxidoreductase YjgC